MSLTGLTLIGVLITVAVALAVGAGWLRVHRHTAIAVVAVVVSLSSAVGAALAAANREVLMYPTWSALVGSERAVSNLRPAGTPGIQTKVLSTSGSGSTISEYSIAEPVRGSVRTVYVYTPPGYADPANATVRYPVIQVFNGFPGGPLTWLYRLHLGRYLDAEIAAGRMAPTVAVIAEQNLSPSHDSECVNAVHGPPEDRWLSGAVVASVKANFRVRDAAVAWGTLGYSTGGFCAVNIAWRHPRVYSAAASLSGYFTPLVDRTTGNLYHGDTAAYHANDPLWQLQHHPGRTPPLPIYAGAGGGDHQAMKAIADLMRAARPPVQITPAVLPTGGHSMAVWDTLLAPALDWLSRHLAGPSPAGAALTTPTTPTPARG